jgi:phosphomevalonate decarboxylase
MKATATAHPTQGLITYGLLDEQFSLPFFDSISVCTAPLKTVITFTFEEELQILINGAEPDPITSTRIAAVVSEVKRLSGIEGGYKTISEDNFPLPTRSSDSRIAALAVAAAKAAGLDLSHKELSRIAQRGGVSASKAVTGWFSRWRANLDRESSFAFVIEDDLDIGMVVALAEPYEYTPETNLNALSSPFLESRLKSVHTSLYEMERAIKDHDIPKIGKLAERDSIAVRALTLREPRESAWEPNTLRVIREVKALREEGIKAYFNSDRGIVFVNSYPEDVPVIEERIGEVGFNPVCLSVGGKAEATEQHLF